MIVCGDLFEPFYNFFADNIILPTQLLPQVFKLPDPLCLATSPPLYSGTSRSISRMRAQSLTCSATTQGSIENNDDSIRHNGFPGIPYSDVGGAYRDSHCTRPAGQGFVSRVYEYINRHDSKYRPPDSSPSVYRPDYPFLLKPVFKSYMNVDHDYPLLSSPSQPINGNAPYSSPNLSSRGIPNKATALQSRYPTPSGAKLMPLYNLFLVARSATRSGNPKAMDAQSSCSLRLPYIHTGSPAGESEANPLLYSPPEEYSSIPSSSLTLSSAIDMNKPRQIDGKISGRLCHLNIPIFFGSNIVPGRNEQPYSDIPIDQSDISNHGCQIASDQTSIATQPSMNVEKDCVILPDKLIHGLRHANTRPKVTEIITPQLPYKDLTGQVEIDHNYFAFGGGSDVYKGEWKDPSSNKGIPVVVKKPRIRGKINEETLNKYRKRLHREILVWSPLKNRNILPLIGVCNVGPSSVPALIAPYCGGGDVMSYLLEFPGANKTRLIEEITNGLQYLHSKNIVHGDLKCENVLVRQNGEACICDFGISKIIGRRGFTTHFAGTWDFMAPELFWTPDGADEDFSPSPTKSSDMYAYALVVLQILTGVPPARVLGIPKALNRDRYDPEGRIVNCQLWELLSRCCLPDPAMRPGIDDVVEFWSNAAGF